MLTAVIQAIASETLMMCSSTSFVIPLMHLQFFHIEMSQLVNSSHRGTGTVTRLRTARFRTVSVVVAGLTLTLSGCSTTPEPVAPKPVAAKPAPVKVVKRHIPKPAHPPARPPEPAREEASPEAPVAAAPPAPTAAPAPVVAVAPEPASAPASASSAPAPVPAQMTAQPPQPIDVVGKSEADVVALLGRPRQEQTASAAKVMRFAADGCEVEVHLFPDVRQGGYRVLETSSGGLPASQCLGKVRAARG